MSSENRPADPAIPARALRLARACRRVVQACLREEEWADADEEFARIIAAGLEEHRRESGRRP